MAMRIDETWREIAVLRLDNGRAVREKAVFDACYAAGLDQQVGAVPRCACAVDNAGIPDDRVSRHTRSLRVVVDRLGRLHEAVARFTHCVQPPGNHDAGFREVQFLLSDCADCLQTFKRQSKAS